MAFKRPELNPPAQHELLEQVTALVVDTLPPSWLEAVIVYRHVGRANDASVSVKDAGGSEQMWEPPVETWGLFQRLRDGMYREGEGTWFSVRYLVRASGRFEVDYDWTNRPDFADFPPADQFAAEQERFPREEAHMPDWFRQQLRAG
ncbi:hypothetical protein [Streptomyces sp. NPDC050560]|uniref:hypothetical protein n=1 Tax=Streptomyces sp. NPDC050560 TaxID=3365630 RepID=UPI00378AD32B